MKLTKDQIEICRLPDCFAPTPKEHIDVPDQVIGTHKWAEQLRWKQHFYLQSLKEGNNTNKEFVKFLWTIPTSKDAPKGDAALELFIEKCSKDFLNPENRRRIKDNLTFGQRSALKELKHFPTTHGVACRYADKSGATVITDMKDDEALIMKT